MLKHIMFNSTPVSHEDTAVLLPDHPVDDGFSGTGAETNPNK